MVANYNLDWLTPSNCIRNSFFSLLIASCSPWPRLLSNASTSSSDGDESEGDSSDGDESEGDSSDSLTYEHNSWLLLSGYCKQCLH